LEDCNVKTVNVVIFANILELNQTPGNSASDHAPSCLTLILYLLYQIKLKKKVYKCKQTTKNADKNIADDNCQSFKGYSICVNPDHVGLYLQNKHE